MRGNGRAGGLTVFALSANDQNPFGLYKKEESHLSVLGISLKGNEEQQEASRLIMTNDIPVVIITGAAGTGKDFVTMATSLELLNQKKYRKIIYTRNPVEVGKSLGFLKGSLEDKFEPYMCPLYDTFESLCRNSMDKISPRELQAKVDVEPLGFLRGRNFAPGTILIVDECQNLNLASIKTVLTRMSDYCKVILLGSMNQIDDIEQRKKDKCDFQRVIDKFEDVQTPWVAHVELVKSMRSKWCAELDNILEELG